MCVGTGDTYKVRRDRPLRLRERHRTVISVQLVQLARLCDLPLRLFMSGFLPTVARGAARASSKPCSARAIAMSALFAQGACQRCLAARSAIHGRLCTAVQETKKSVSSVAVGFMAPNLAAVGANPFKQSWLNEALCIDSAGVGVRWSTVRLADTHTSQDLRW